MDVVSLVLWLVTVLGRNSAASASRPGYVLTYKQHERCDASRQPSCANSSSLNYCLEDDDYPLYEIKAYIHADAIFRKKYSDVRSQSAEDLVENVSRSQERDFSYPYTGASTLQDSPYDVSHWAGPEGYACPSDVVYAALKRAQNGEGRWRVVVSDAPYYSQTVRLETCSFPSAACRTLAPCYKSACAQKYVYHRLLSWDPCDPYRGLFVDTYKLPSACSCHVPAK
ncbi:LOW QUALITY PROTEIN: neurotrophin 1-like [Macrobrachium nipponense]|uniref:LOW QUALITY PROTEIN: neurotrophin 1-like n=1 Tax=Macrobrachium nipponense TaxID=159736 RepID=UPI0030C898B7